MKPFSILLLVGALFIAGAVLTTHWIAGGYDESTFHGGLYSSGYCHLDECDTQFLIKFLFKGSGLKGTLGILLGMVTLLAGLTTAVLATLSAFATKAGRRGPLTLAFVFAISTGVAGVLYLLLVNGVSPGHLGYSTLLFLVGVGAAITGSVLAMKAFPTAPRPMMMMGYGQPMGYGMPGMPPIYGQQPGMPPAYGQQPGYMQPPPQMQPQTPPCNQCGGQTQFVQQYNKLFCGRCNRYLV